MQKENESQQHKAGGGSNLRLPSSLPRPRILVEMDQRKGLHVAVHPWASVSPCLSSGRTPDATPHVPMLWEVQMLLTLVLSPT